MPNVFGAGFFRLKRFPKIGLPVFPSPKRFSVQIFRVKTSFQNWFSEFVTDYGTADLGAGACALPAPAPVGTGSPSAAGLAPPATATGTGPATGCGQDSGHRWPRTGTATARPHGRHRQRQATATGRRGEAPARLRPDLNKKAGNP